MHTEAINHDPAITFFQTGSQHRRAARRIGLVAVATASAPRTRTCRRSSCCCRAGDRADQPLYARLWGSGFLPSQHQGVQFRRRQGPGALPRRPRRRQRRDAAPHARPLARARTNEPHAERCSTPRSNARIAQYEMAYRMQTIGAGGDRLSPTSRKRASSSTAPTCRRPARSPPTACSPGAWPSAACGSSSSTTRAGTSTATCRRTSGQCRDDRPAVGGAGHGSRAARPARRHAGHLGRRVRPHRLLAGQAHRRRTTAATTIRAASPSGWPAAA